MDISPQGFVRLHAWPDSSSWCLEAEGLQWISSRLNIIDMKGRCNWQCYDLLPEWPPDRVIQSVGYIEVIMWSSLDHLRRGIVPGYTAVVAAPAMVFKMGSRTMLEKDGLLWVTVICHYLSSSSYFMTEWGHWVRWPAKRRISGLSWKSKIELELHIYIIIYVGQSKC